MLLKCFLYLQSSWSGVNTRKLTKIINMFNKSLKNVIVYCSNPPEVYGNLRLFCLKKGLNEHKTSRGGFPFSFEGVEVHKTEIISGTIDKYIMNLIKNALLLNRKEGSHFVTLTDKLVKEIKLNYEINKGVYIIKDFSITNKFGYTINNKITRSKIEKLLNK